MLAPMISRWKTMEAISERIIITVGSLKRERNKVAISNIVARGDNLEEKGETIKLYLLKNFKSTT